jgi:hypothetical protein
MTRRQLLLTAYWTAAIADFAYGTAMLIPARAGVSDYVYPMGLFAAVAYTWGILLVLATRRPFERRWVLVPTIIVILLLGIASLYSLAVGAIEWAIILPRLVLKLLLVVMLLYVYVKTRET